MWDFVIDAFAHAEGVKQLRSRAPDSYAWLYRNDRDWLFQTRPAPRAGLPLRRRAKPLGLRKPATIIASFQKAATNLKEQAGMPRRVTRGRITAAAGFEKDFDWAALPESDRAKIDGLLEDRRSFLNRRLQWARAELQKEGVQVTSSALLRMAAIRPSSLSAEGLDLAGLLSDFTSALRKPNAA
jgi:hypothetical protein